jgi:hypothetical protein
MIDGEIMSGIKPDKFVTNKERDMNIGDNHKTSIKVRPVGPEVRMAGPPPNGSRPEKTAWKCPGCDYWVSPDEKVCPICEPTMENRVDTETKEFLIE